MMPTQDDVLAMGPRGAARLIRDTYLSAGLSPERTAVIDEQLDVVLASGSGDAWRAACTEIWRDDGLRAECDRHKGLRTVVRRSAVGSVLEAITDLLAQRCASRQDDAHLIAAADGALWITDMQFRDLVYHLELNDFGCGPAWDADGDVEDLLSRPEGPQGLWRRWVSWACAGEPARRAFVAHPAYVGSFPAWGLPIRSARVRPILEASRRCVPNGPLLVVGTRPVLLPWTPSRLPSLPELVARTRSPEERAAIRFPWTVAGYRRAVAKDPLAAMTSLLTRTGEPTASRALVEVLRAAVLALAPLGTLTESGVLEVVVPTRPRLARIHLTRSGDRLLVGADGLAAVTAWVGIFPFSYHPSGGPWTWSWTTLAYCGWHGLESSGRWVRGRFAQEPVASVARNGWIAFPPGALPCDLPPLAQRARIVTESPPSMCEMSIETPWDPPEPT